MPPHAHGGGEEDEAPVVLRSDGPPFVDLKAPQGKGFDTDFERVQRYLGPGKVRARARAAPFWLAQPQRKEVNATSPPHPLRRSRSPTSRATLRC
jgi:hypothetical protein